jgi:hypothetical protein
MALMRVWRVAISCLLSAQVGRRRRHNLALFVSSSSLPTPGVVYGCWTAQLCFSSCNRRLGSRPREPSFHQKCALYRAKPFLSEWVGPPDLARSNHFDTRNGHDNTTHQQSWAMRYAIPFTIIKEYATER